MLYNPIWCIKIAMRGSQAIHQNQTPLDSALPTREAPFLVSVYIAVCRTKNLCAGASSAPAKLQCSHLSGPLEGRKMRIREFGAFTWTPYGCQNWSPTRPSNPGLKSSTPLRENEGFLGSGGLESGPPGPGFEGFRAKAEG